MMGTGLFRKGMRLVMWWVSACEAGFLAHGKKCTPARSMVYSFLARVLVAAWLVIAIATTIGLAFLRLELAALYAVSQIGVLLVPMILMTQQQRSVHGRRLITPWAIRMQDTSISWTKKDIEGS